MRKINIIEPSFKPLPKRKRVAAYARVSKETDRLLNSASAQISNYSKVIQSNTEWEFAGVYSDIGISGLNTKAREGFNELIEDCKKGKIDIILTKSISRFARNSVDLLETTRLLKELGVEVRFERENINSLSGDGELMLSILGSFAQEESMSISNNIKWAIRKRYENGTIGIRNKRVFGYKLVDDTYEIETNEAKYVKKIFEMYQQGIPILTISKYLSENNVKTIRGCEFSVKQLQYILMNEIYVGDLLLQKFYIDNPLNKSRVENTGQLPQYYMEDCHEPIIDRELFEEVQKIINEKTRKNTTRSVFSGKIKCGICGENYNRREYPTTVNWYCRSKNIKNRCNDSIILREEKLKEISMVILDLKEFNSTTFKNEIINITVHKNKDLEFKLKNGRTKVWQEQ